MPLADKGYDANDLRQAVRDRNAWANIPPKANRNDPICFSKHLYKARNRVGRFFNKIKNFRRIATRFDKNAKKPPVSRGLCKCLLGSSLLHRRRRDIDLHARSHGRADGDAVDVGALGARRAGLLNGIDESADVSLDLVRRERRLGDS
jgi:transposase